MNLADAAAAIDAKRFRRDVESVSTPSSLLHCFDPEEGEFDLCKLARHLQRQADAVELALLDISNDSSVIKREEPPKKRCSRNRKPILAKRNKEGEMEPISPRESWWYSKFLSQRKTH